MTKDELIEFNKLKERVEQLEKIQERFVGIIGGVQKTQELALKRIQHIENPFTIF